MAKEIKRHKRSNNKTNVRALSKSSRFRTAIRKTVRNQKFYFTPQAGDIFVYFDNLLNEHWQNYRAVGTMAQGMAN